MKEIKYYCNHCGKKLDIMNDYFDMEVAFDSLVCEKHIDLCNDCFLNINNIISKFCSEAIKKDRSGN